MTVVVFFVRYVLWLQNYDKTLKLTIRFCFSSYEKCIHHAVCIIFLC